MQLMINKIFLILISAVLFAFNGFSQDISIISADYSPIEIGIGEESQLTIEIANDIDIPANSIEVQLSLPFNIYASKSSVTPNVISDHYFNWTLKENNYWSGINITPLPEGEPIIISLQVIGLNESYEVEIMGQYGIIRQFTSSDFLVRAIANLDQFISDDNTNNYMQADLSVVGNTNNILLEQVNPLNLSVDNSVGSNLIMQFDQNISVDSGILEVRDFYSDDLVEQIGITDSKVTISGNILTVDIKDLDNDKTYYITMSSGAVVGESSNIFPGINGKSIWSFTTLSDPNLITCIQESFETASGYTFTNSFDDGSFSFFGRYSVPDFLNAARNDIITGWDGSFGIIGQNFDISGMSDTQDIIVDPIDISSFVEYSVSIGLAALDSEPVHTNFESGDGIVIKAIIDDNPMFVLAEFAPNSTGDSDLYLDTDGDGIGDGEKLTRELKSFTFNDNLVTGETLELIISLTSNEAFELLAVDNIRVHSGDVSDCIDNNIVIQETPIYTIQGDSQMSSFENQVATTTGVVVGEYLGVNKLEGLFIQDLNGDNDVETSDGIFVHLESDNANASTPIFIGDQIRVTGLITEDREHTRIDHIQSIELINVGHEIPPTSISLPETVDGQLERYESMFVSIDHDMQVSQNFFLGRYGQVTLSSPDDDGNFTRIKKPTNVYRPNTPEAIALQEENNRRLLILDDGQEFKLLGDNPDPVPYLDLEEEIYLRPGDKVQNLTGFIDQGQINSNISSPAIDYRIHPLTLPTVQSENIRENSPSLSQGMVNIASFNLLNYFNGDGQGGGFPTSRGADSFAEFERQSAKIETAINLMGADIIGLVEIENDGFSSESAIQELVARLNASGNSYSFVNAEMPIGTDAICVGILYDNTKVAPVGNYAILDGSVNPLFDDQKNRPSLAQSFQHIESSEVFTVAVNHFKSKGSNCDSVGDPDVNDGQGNCNKTRENAAQALAEWLATNPTGVDDPDLLIIGDLNSYLKEDPIIKLEDEGFETILGTVPEDDQYTFIFDGESGMLDHMLGSQSILNQVSGFDIWHINTDEAKVLDYDEDFNPDQYYQSNQFRSSDHDPVLISLNLGNCSDHLVITENTVLNGLLEQQANISLNSNSDVSGNGELRYRAGDNISLTGGFTVKQGVLFNAKIQPCQ